MRNPYQFYAVVLPGLETIAAQELNHLSAHDIREDEGGVHFSGTLDILYRVSLRARSITRVLLRIGKCHAMSAPELEHQIAHMRWEHVIPQGSSLAVKASTEHSKLTHSEHIAEAVEGGIRQALGKRLKESGKSLQTIYIHITNNRCDIRVDCSGERLDRRGYRLASAKAPIRETLAAGLLQWMGWKGDETLYVPMCGSGTFAIEAAQMDQHIASNSNHVFPFSDWDIFKKKRWQRVLERTQSMKKEPTCKIEVTDLQLGAIKACESNSKRAGVLSSIHLSQQDIRQLTPQNEETGLIMCNPPYGLRIESEGEAFYQMLGSILKKSFAGWRIMVICPSWKHERALGMPVRRRLKVRHGGLWLEALDVSQQEISAYKE